MNPFVSTNPSASCDMRRPPARETVTHACSCCHCAVAVRSSTIRHPHSRWRLPQRSMMIRATIPSRLSRLSASLVAATAIGCGRKPSLAPRRSPRRPLIVNHERAPAGSPLELTYKFVVASDAKFDEDYRVFVHVVDTDEESMWTDDHYPPCRPRSGSRARRSSTRAPSSCRCCRMSATRAFYVGLHSTKDQKRVPLGGEDVGQHAYKVAHHPAAAADR